MVCVATTFPADQCAAVGHAQKSVVEEALHHGSVEVEACGQVLGADGRPTDEQRQSLAHRQRLEQLPAQTQAKVLNIIKNEHCVSSRSMNTSVQ